MPNMHSGSGCKTGHHGLYEPVRDVPAAQRSTCECGHARTANCRSNDRGPRVWLRRGSLKGAEITDFRWHDPGHAWASWLRQNDVPTWVLQELGGWKSETMVRRPAHMSVKDLQPSADQLLFEGKSGHIGPLGEGPGRGHNTGHSESPFRLKLVAGTDLGS